METSTREILALAVVITRSNIRIATQTPSECNPEWERGKIELAS